MIIPCNAANGCKPRFVQVENQARAGFSDQTVRDLPYSQMTDFIAPVPETSDAPSNTGVIASTVPLPGNGQTLQAAETIPGQPDPPFVPGGGNVPDNILPESPQFTVPNNPLLPPGYQEVSDYDALQYLNGFLRTQIGKYVRIQQLIGSSVIEDRYGYLVGVGLNYLLLQEINTGNILALDFYNIKYVYIYYTKTALPTNEIR